MRWNLEVTATIELSPEDEQRLSQILKPQPGILGEALAPYASAALEEYVRMFLGARVYTRGSDIREYRLQLLIKHANGGAIPDDDYVSALFQTNVGQSRGLTRAVLSKFQYDLEAVDRARREQGSDPWTVVIRSSNVVSALNREIEILDGALPLVTRTPATAARYEIKRSTYLRLCGELGVGVKDDDDN